MQLDLNSTMGLGLAMPNGEITTGEASGHDQAPSDIFSALLASLVPQDNTPTGDQGGSGAQGQATEEQGPMVCTMDDPAQPLSMTMGTEGHVLMEGSGLVKPAPVGLNTGNTAPESLPDPTIPLPGKPGYHQGLTPLATDPVALPDPMIHEAAIRPGGKIPLTPWSTDQLPEPTIDQPTNGPRSIAATTPWSTDRLPDPMINHQGDRPANINAPSTGIRAELPEAPEGRPMPATYSLSTKAPEAQGSHPEPIKPAVNPEEMAQSNQAETKASAAQTAEMTPASRGPEVSANASGQMAATSEPATSEPATTGVTTTEATITEATTTANPASTAASVTSATSAQATPVLAMDATPSPSLGSPTVTATMEPEMVHTPVDPEKIQAQVLQQIAARDLPQSGTQKMTLQLNPGHLGKVEVQIIAQGDRLEVTFNATTTEAMQALRMGADDLTKALVAQAGAQLGTRWQQVDVKVAEVEASDQDQTQDEDSDDKRQGDDERQRRQDQQRRRNRGRR